MTIKDTFPLFFSSYQPVNHTFWEGSLIGSQFDTFIEFVEDKFYEASLMGTDEFHSTAYLLLRDILSSKINTAAQELEILHFLQFYISVSSASYLSQKGLFTMVYDWLVWSILDNIEYEAKATFQLDRIGLFFQTKNLFISNNRTYLYIKWMTTLFYYSRNQGGLKELAKLILNQEFIKISTLPTIIGLDFEEDEALDLLCQALGWSIDNKETTGYKLARLIKGWIPQLGPANQKTANLQLATGGAHFTDEKPQFYAKQVLENYSEYCRGHELLHAQSIYFTSNLAELEFNPEPLKKAFYIYLSGLKDLGENSKKYEKGKIFGIIRGLVVSCLKSGKAKLAFYILREFYEKGGDFDKHLFLVLNIEKQICTYVSDNMIISGEEVSTDEYRHLIQISNRFLGTKISIHDDPHFILEEPKYLGFPDKELGIEFEKVLSKYYCTYCLNKPDLTDFYNLVILPGHQHPIQPLMVKELGYSAPINTSLETPKTVKKIDKVLLWCYGTLSSDRELEIIPKIFQKSGVDVHAVNILEETKESFLKKYNDPIYDIIWVATHGNYNHMLPHKSTLSILPNIEISIEELVIQQSDFKHQRLLFLNVCDGATSATNGSLYEHGFGATLANSSQCVISHLWPVETEPALFYGVLFATNLNNYNFWDSYERTVKMLCQDGKRSLQPVAEKFKEIDFNGLDEKIVEGIEKNIYYWGSSVFYN